VFTICDSSRNEHLREAAKDLQSIGFLASVTELQLPRTFIELDCKMHVAVELIEKWNEETNLAEISETAMSALAALKIGLGEANDSEALAAVALVAGMSQVEFEFSRADELLGDAAFAIYHSRSPEGKLWALKLQIFRRELILRMVNPPLSEFAKVQLNAVGKIIYKLLLEGIDQRIETGDFSVPPLLN